MSDRSMTKALASIQTSKGQMAIDPLGVDAKVQAMESPEVSAFIKQGASGAAGSSPATPGARVRNVVQLNAKIPSDLHGRALRAVFENRLGGIEPTTLQDLVANALRAELKRLGF